MLRVYKLSFIEQATARLLLPAGGGEDVRPQLCGVRKSVGIVTQNAPIEISAKKGRAKKPGLIEFGILILRCFLLTGEFHGIKKSSVLLFRVIKE
jgi:hypothetical protein